MSTVCSQIWKSKCIKELRYLLEGKTTPTTVICRSFMFITAGINSSFTARDMLSVKVKHNYLTPYLLSAEHNYLSMFLPPYSQCVLLPLSSSSSLLSLISSSAPCLLRHIEGKQEKARREFPNETGWWSSQREEVKLLRCLLLEGSTSERLQRPSSLNVRFHLYKHYNENSSSVNLHTALQPQPKWDKIRAEGF